MAHRLGLLQLVQLLEPAIGPSLQPWSVATSLMLSQEMSGDNGWGEVWGSRGCGGKALGTKWVNTYSVYLFILFNEGNPINPINLHELHCEAVFWQGPFHSCLKIQR